MAKQFLKRTIIGILMTMMFVIVASLTYEHVVPVVLSMDSSTIHDSIGTGKKMLDDAKNTVTNITKQKVPQSAETDTDKKSQDTSLESIKYNIDQESIKDTIQYKDVVSGAITKVVDGDTLDIDSTRIRLALVDTPERGQAGYEKATSFTRALCPVGTTAMYDIDSLQTQGSYGRVIAKVWCFGYQTNSEVSLNESLINSGHARILQQYCSTSEFSKDKWAVPHC